MYTGNRDPDVCEGKSTLHGSPVFVYLEKIVVVNELIQMLNRYCYR